MKPRVHNGKIGSDQISRMCQGFKTGRASPKYPIVFSILFAKCLAWRGPSRERVLTRGLWYGGVHPRTWGIREDRQPQQNSSEQPRL